MVHAHHEADSTLARPFVKWLGGKAGLIPTIERLISDEDAIHPRDPLTNQSFRTYFEAFVGGGSLLWHLHKLKRFHRAVINDKCRDLISAYSLIQSHPRLIIQELTRWQRRHDENVKMHEMMYYDLRAYEPESDLDRAVRFLVLNKTCFRGLYRENSKGKFNTPFGNYNRTAKGEWKPVKLFDEDNIMACSRALQDVEIRCGDYRNTVMEAQAGDLVYFDPPYVPTSNTAKFVAYHGDGFDYNEQIRLRDTVSTLIHRGVRCVLSNAAAGRDLYASLPVTIHSVTARRAINPYNTGSVAEEIIVIG